MHRTFMHTILGAGALCLVAVASYAQNGQTQLGRAATAEEVKQQDITVLPTGAGLPKGKGTAVEGEAVYRSRCASCHGDNAENPKDATLLLVGGKGTLASDRPIKTIGSYWPYATTLWDYINRAMPYDRPGTLSPDDIYSVAAFLLYRNGIIGQNEEMTSTTLPEVRMPNRDGFVPDGRPEIRK